VAPEDPLDESKKLPIEVVAGEGCEGGFDSHETEGFADVVRDDQRAVSLDHGGFQRGEVLQEVSPRSESHRAFQSDTFGGRQGN
jgi:hypothetical protein